jgi:Dihydroxyacetone kinase
VERGRVQRGEKTMLDAIAPGVETFRNAIMNGNSLEEAARIALAAVEEGMRATIPMQATKGRAAFLGPRSIGHQDPGATSAYYIARAMVGLDDDLPARTPETQNP